MRAIVAGAGIAGLVVARELVLAGWEVAVVEKSAGPRPDGYMMDFFGAGVEAAERIGLYPRLADAAYPVEAAEYVDTRGRRTCSIDYRTFTRLAGGKVLSLLRPDLELAALAALDDVPAGNVRLHYGAAVAKAWEDSDGVHITVQGPPERTLSADVLIGADGIHSEVRSWIFGPEEQYLRPMGMRAAAFIARDQDLNRRFRNRFVLTDSLNKMAGMYGIRSDEVAAFLVYRPPDNHNNPADNPDVQERLRQEFTGLGNTVDRLMQLCPKNPYDDLVAQIIMPGWHTSHCVLVGDACGAVSLLAGQGGSLAVAGAALLGETLRRADAPAQIAPAIADFERTWRPRILTAQEAGRRAARSFLPRNPAQRLARRWIIRATHVPGIDRYVGRQILARTAP